MSHYWLEGFGRAGFETVSLDATNVNFGLHKSLFDLAARKQLRKQLRPGDILLVHEPLSGSFVGLGAPLVVFSHGIEVRLAALTRTHHLHHPSLKSLLTRPLWLRRDWVGRRGLRLADLALVLNRDDYDYVLSHYGRSAADTFLYRNGVCAAEKIPERGLGRGVLFLGSWIERKGIGLLREAYRRLRADGADLRWRFAGTGLDEARVRGYLGAADDARVEIIPHFRAADEGKIFEQIDIFVLPSYMEGQPLALLQAMEYGRCCIATRTCGQKDVLVDGENGLLFEPGDADGFIRQIRAAVASTEFRAQLGLKARAATENRCWPVVADEVVAAVSARLVSKQR